jgi:PDZ domain-containing protein
MKIAFLIVVNVLAIWFGVVLDREQIIQMPGGLIRVEEQIILDQAFDVEGELNSVFIYSMNQHTRLLRFFATGAPGVQVIDQSPAALDLPASELNLRGRLLYDASIQASLIQAFNAANIPLETEFLGLRVVFGPADSEVRIGTLITKVNDEDVTSLAMFVETISGVATITINDTYTMSRNEEGFFGITIMEENNIVSSDVGYEVVPRNVQGNSAGLMQTLNLYNRLVEEDITKGLRIAGTGTMDVQGRVGPIGGVRQKVITAARDGIDVFFVPAADFADARAELDLLNTSMKLISVATFQDAIEALNSL